MKYLQIFGFSSATMIAILALSAIVSGTSVGPGSLVLALGIGAMITGLYWLFKNEPPQDKERPEDTVTRLWRS